MIRQLRAKFVWINMSLVVVVLALLCAVVFASTQSSLRRDSQSALTQAVNLSASGGYSSYISPDSRGQSQQGVLSAGQAIQLPFCTVQVTGESTVVVLANQFFDTDDREVLLSAVEQVLASDADSGALRLEGYRLRYLRVNTVFGSRIAFVDRTQELSTLSALGRNLTLISLGALGVFLIISLLLARWAVRPVEKSWTQQRQFVADASHELKTPLTVILSSLDMLEECPEAEEDKRRRWLENVRTCSMQMKTLVEELLVLARSDNATQPTAIVRCDLSQLVEDDLLLFEPLAYEQGKVIQEELTPALAVNGDPELLRRILDIYLDNACKYAPQGSTITVKLTGENKRVVLAVQSQGAPIPKEQLEHLFERFYRADPSRTQEGYGLGLAIAQELAKLHQGKVWATSSEGGNVFYLALPRLRP